MEINQFALNFKDILIDEIALSGLEGVGFDLLWRLTEKRIASPVTEKLKGRFWNFIAKCKEITIYQVPEPVPYVEIVDRFSIVDEVTGHILDPPDYLDGPYKYCPIDNDDYGSCVNYKTRIRIPKEDLVSIPYGQVAEMYGDQLVMVASIEERWRALAPHMSITYLTQLSQTHYCILELVGRGRNNGQFTIGKTNLLKILKDSKLLFYNRNFLQTMDLIRAQSITQVVANRGLQCILLRLKRFHKPKVQTMPTVGKIHDVMEYLIKQPDYSQRTDVLIKQGFYSAKMIKKLQKTNNIFHFEERTVCIEDPIKKCKSNNSKQQEIKRRFMCVTSPSDDESSHSDEEANVEPLKCQYKVKVNILRQAYELLVETGLKGLSQVELAQLLGVEFYTSRAICRCFKLKNIVRQFMEDKGKQRITRYIAVTSTGEMNEAYEKEKQQFLQYIVDSRNNAEPPSVDAAVATENISNDEIPSKRRKLEGKDSKHENVVVDCQNLHKQITEVKVLDGLENHNMDNFRSIFSSKRVPTLRQLRFANGIMKVVREKQVISGFQTLSCMVAKEICEPPMDTKALKVFVQKLVSDGQLKVMKMKQQGFNGDVPIVIICAPHVKSTDPVIKAKYKELKTRAINNKKNFNKKSAVIDVTRPMSQFAYPKYMKIQKLHEVLVKVVLLNEGEVEASELPPGFSSLVQIIPEFTVEFALGNISKYTTTEIPPASATDPLLSVKLRNTPNEIFRLFLLSPSLQRSLRTNLKILAMLGLIQLVKEASANCGESVVLSYVFYVNRHAKILDTRGVWPRQNVDTQKLEKSYCFESFQDVEKYWNDVYEISTTTTIDLVSRPSKKLLPPLRSQHEVLSHDNGEIFGDCKGTCGFDSVFYMEIPRLWSTFYSKEKKHQKPMIQNKPKINLPKKEVKKKPKQLKRKRRSVVPKPAYESQIRLKRKRRGKIDPTLKWSQEEDNIIIFCKAAITIISPVSQPGCLRLRNYVSKDILTLGDPKKTAGFCHKRAMYLESNTTLAYEKECIINELRYRGNLVSKYDGLLKKLRLRYSCNMSKLIQEGRLPMLELVWMMMQLVRSKNYKKRIPCVAMDFEDFHKNFTITTASANRYLNLYKTPEDCDPAICAIKEGIILTVMTSYKRELPADTAKNIYTMFNMHSENNLRTAIEQLRKSSAVAAKEKIMNNQMHRFHFQDIVQSSYKVSVGYERKWISRLNAEFVERMMGTVHEELPQNSLKGCPALNCLFCELHTSNKLDIISVSLPVITVSSGSIIQEEQLNTCDMETKFSLKSGTSGWRNKTNVKKFCDLYQHIDVEKNLKTLIRNTVVEPKKTRRVDKEDKIIAHLIKKQETGSTFLELQELTGFDSKTLTSKLTSLETQHVIKRVGYYENVIVLTEFTTTWSLTLDDTNVIPSPWLTIKKDIRRDVFLKWAGVVLNKIFENPGCSISYLSESCEFLTARSAQDMCMFLEKCECVTLNVMIPPKAGLFSDEDIMPELDDFNLYESVESIIVFPVQDSLTKYACIRKKILNK